MAVVYAYWEYAYTMYFINQDLSLRAMNIYLGMETRKRRSLKSRQDKCFARLMINEELNYLLKSTDPNQTKAFLKDFVYKIKTKRYLSISKWLLSIIGALFLIACVFKTGFLDKRTYWILRKTSIKMISSVGIGGGYIRNKRCLIPNPSIITRELDVNDCDQCETIDDVILLNQSNKSEFMPLVKQDIPVVVMEEELHKPDTYDSVAEFVHLFLSVNDLSLYEPCGFASNLKRKTNDHRELLQLVDTGGVISLYAHWENCADISYKAFRQFYQRPNFLPPNVQLTDPNWVMICSNYQGKFPKVIDNRSPLFMLIVLKGHVDITIKPWAVCNASCTEITYRLHSGWILLLTDTLWELNYTPSCKGNETILIGVNGYFD